MFYTGRTPVGRSYSNGIELVDGAGAVILIRFCVRREVSLVEKDAGRINVVELKTFISGKPQGVGAHSAAVDGTLLRCCEFAHSKSFHYG